jgi:ribonuclease T1
VHFSRVLLCASFVFFASSAVTLDVCAREAPQLREVGVAELPKEARDTLALIRKGGPFPYRKDGATFGNFEKQLPTRARGYYREYTVATPGARVLLHG